MGPMIRRMLTFFSPVNCPVLFFAAAEFDERDFPLWPFFAGPLIFVIGIAMVWKARKK